MIPVLVGTWRKFHDSSKPCFHKLGRLTLIVCRNIVRLRKVKRMRIEKN